MTSKIWRLAHLALAVVTFIFLMIASLTGVVLAFHAVNERSISSFESVPANELTLAEALPVIQNKYPAVNAVSVNKFGHVIVETTDADFNPQKLIINPHNGDSIAPVRVESKFVQWNLSLHRSLFLHETGRFIVGVVSFLFIIIIVSGVMLIIKRQQGVRKFFAKQPSGSKVVKWHVWLGRTMFIPLFITAFTGTYLFMKRFQLLPEKQAVTVSFNNQHSEKIPLKDFPVFNEITFAELNKVDFPFFEDTEEYFVLKLKDRELKINQFNGTIIEETRYPYDALFKQLSFDLHTGSGSSLWAIILAIASLSIVGFAWTGFAITYKRTHKKRRNKFKAKDAEIVILTGTENGSTRKFAASVFEQLEAQGHKVYMCDMNDFRHFESLQHLLVFCSTYGKGEAPASACGFKKRLKKLDFSHKVKYSIVGFGSIKYEDFCAYAFETEKMLSKQKWAKPLLETHTVNKRSATEFAAWAKAWSEKSRIKLSDNPDNYIFKKNKEKEN